MKTPSTPDQVRRVQKAVVNAWRSGRLVLPTLPDVALKIREALADDRVGSTRLARIVQAEPLLSARLVQVANSPRYRGYGPVEDCHGAIQRLGLDATRNLATGLALRSAYVDPDPRLRRLLESFWHRACRVASIAHVLAGMTPGARPDRVLLAGIVYNIGALPIVAWLRDHPEELEHPGVIAAAVVGLQGRLGSSLLGHWGFEQGTAEVPRALDDWQRSHPGPPDDIDLLLVARAHAQFGEPEPGLKRPVLSEMPALAKFPFARFGADGSLQLIEEANAEIASLMRLLHG